jgi:hypothetical protein
MRVRSASGEASFTIRFLEAYVRRRGRWELVAWQSSMLPSKLEGQAVELMVPCSLNAPDDVLEAEAESAVAGVGLLQPEVEAVVVAA